jgi:HAL2 family 3'(2'),5'-bisphosphate nucleotidase
LYLFKLHLPQSLGPRCIILVMDLFNKMAPEAQFAVNFLREASVLARMIQDGMVDPALEKSDRSPVTVADIAVQALLGYHLSERIPGAALIAEESSSMLTGEAGMRIAAAAAGFISSIVPEFRGQSFRTLLDYGTGCEKPGYWVLDPIDGTKGFLRKNQYAVALSYLNKGNVKLGALACPRLAPESPARFSSAATGSIYIAVKGQGAFWTGDQEKDWRRLHVSETKNPSRAVIMRSFEPGHTDGSNIDRITEKLGTEAEPLRVDSQVKYALLALGKGDVYLRIPSPATPDYVEKIWDHAAGKLIVEEAGGKVSDISGNPLDFSRGRFLDQNKGVIGTNGPLHTPVLKALNEVCGDL